MRETYSEHLHTANRTIDTVMFNNDDAADDIDVLILLTVDIGYTTTTNFIRITVRDSVKR